MKKYLISVFIIFIYGLFINTCISIYSADVLYSDTQGYLLKNEIVKAIQSINTAIKLNPNEPNYYKERAKALIYVTIDQENQTVELSKRLALNDLETAIKLNNTNLVTIRNIVPLYFFLANKDLTKPTTVDNIDDKYLNVTKTYFDFVQSYAPNDAGVYVLLAKYEKRLGFTNEYSFAKERVNELRPDLLEWNDAFK